MRVTPDEGTVTEPVHRAEYQSNGIPRPGELSVQRKSIRESFRVSAGLPSSLGLSKYSPANVPGTTSNSRIARPGPLAYFTSTRGPTARLMASRIETF